MPVTVEKLDREFVFGGHTLPDPSSELTVEQVRDIYIPAYPEITTATVTGPESVGAKLRYTFSRAIGNKG
jgi:PRTRC genetic system protein C